MKDLSLHILDIAENSINAEAKNIEIGINENLNKDLLTLKITDDGIGMDNKMKEKVTDPFVTTRKTRKIGLGIPLLKSSAESANGKLLIDSAKGKGTTITATFQLSHIDRKPLGKISDTILMLVAGNPDINFKFLHQKNGSKFIFDSKKYKDELIASGADSTGILIKLKKYLKEYNNTLK
jgi:anti-sigma regulatory factor (Ser/Thr protein kinase)